jgi:hypothetical protein
MECDIMKKFMMMLAGGVAALLFSGCVSSEQPANTSAGLNGLQQRALNVRNIGDELGATYKDVWYSTISTLQLNGFILKEADMQSGYIYGVWQDTYERRAEISNGGFTVYQVGGGSNLGIGSFFSKTDTYKQIEVSVTLEPLAETQTLVRLTARFDNSGVPVAEGVFANRFFGLLRKEIFLRKNGGSVYNNFSFAK